MLTASPLEGKLIPIREAARLLSVHANTLRRWSDQGMLPTYRLGNRRDRRFWESDLFSLLRQLQYSPANPTSTPKPTMAPEQKAPVRN